MERQTHTIDADNRVLGRLATEISLLLRGKGKPDFALHKDMGDFVVVKNAAKMIISGKKLEKKKYYRHTGYPGGLKELPMKKLFEKDPNQVLRRAVLGMLPKNRLRAKMIKRLSFSQ